MTEPVILESRLGSGRAADLRAALLACANGATVVDMQHVTQLGALCLQVLISAAKTARVGGRPFQIIGVSDPVLDQMRLMGVAPDALWGEPA